MINITQEEIKTIIQNSRESERKRAPKILRSFRDNQLPSSMFNALQPGTYIRPHRHPSENGKEILIANQGESVAVFFNEKGKITSSFILSLSKTNYLEIPHQTYHTVIALKPDTVLCEIYLAHHSNDSEYKEFAQWAPAEKEPIVEEYLTKITKEALSICL